MEQLLKLVQSGISGIKIDVTFGNMSELIDYINGVLTRTVVHFRSSRKSEGIPFHKQIGDINYFYKEFKPTPGKVVFSAWDDELRVIETLSAYLEDMDEVVLGYRVKVGETVSVTGLYSNFSLECARAEPLDQSDLSILSGKYAAVLALIFKKATIYCPFEELRTVLRHEFEGEIFDINFVIEDVPANINRVVPKYFDLVS